MEIFELPKIERTQKRTFIYAAQQMSPMVAILILQSYKTSKQKNKFFRTYFYTKLHFPILFFREEPHLGVPFSKKAILMGQRPAV